MLHNCYQLFAHKQSCAREMHKIRLNGWCDAQNFGSGIPDTAPYKEWLGIVGSMLVAVLICAVLYAGGVLT